MSNVNGSLHYADSLQQVTGLNDLQHQTAMYPEMGVFRKYPHCLIF